ncbi:hypothetical protein HPP92_008301 [Vanilla planifolia]|uniref:Gag1-like clamp domain-containing protein n=1 Tax=Vanilla planifolia TaxID=51239 RepID=A0A835V7S4_VANPL|nr:hypothetical protein HPP92_008501 [Vanilla planifolia]KAG0486206.1 hypothetical protein HPP92_008301 [Vanilla planifolia]
MANTVSISNSLETRISLCSPPNDANKSGAEKVNDDSFVNHAAIAWVAQRKEWIGDPTRKTRQAVREPIISWCTTYDDLFFTNSRFPQPIPLSEMVDFLVDVWQEEGLYD